MSFLFLTFGPTHSGKTTFGRKLRAELGDTAKFIHVDNDEADEFVKEHFNNLRSDPDILATRTPSNPDLRLLIPQFITNYALKENYSVIATAAHPKRVIRGSYYEIARKHNAKIVLLLFRITEAQAAQRIQAAARSDAILDISPHGGTNFADLFKKQMHVFEEPLEAEKRSCYKVLEISPDNADQVLHEAVRLLKETNR